MSVKTKMTAIADKIRSILGISGKMGLDAMVSNLQTCEDEVDLQEGLLEEALSTLNGKASGGSTAQNAALQNKEITPSANEQIVTPDAGYDGLSYVYVAGDSDLTPGNIKSGVNIFGITGSYAGNQSVENLPILQNPGNEQDVAEGKEFITGDGTTIVGNVPVRDIFMENADDVIISGSILSMYKYDIERQFVDHGVFLKADSAVLGEATPEDVLNGKTFTSKDGIGLIGTKVLNNSTDLPSGISKISYGSFVPSTDLRTFQIQHGLGTQPATCNIFASGNINAADFEGYLITCSILAHCQFDSSVNDGSGVKLQSTQWAVGSGGSIRNYSSWTDDDNSPMSSVDVKLSNISKFKAGIKYHWVCVALDDDV